ncbi:transposase [Escherichia coli]|nr:transposase [Escherichia coli]
MDKPTDWRSGTRRIFSNEFKLHMVELASKPNANVAQLAREHGVDNNLIFKWLRLWQREERISRRMPPTIVSPTVPQSFPASPTLVPVELIDTPRCATDAPAPEALSVACAASCHVEFHYGKMTLENPSPELLTVLIRELTGISLPSGTRIWLVAGVTDMRKSSTVWENRYNMCWMRTPSQVTCSPNAWRKASLSGLRCVTVRYPLPARNWQCSSISWTGVSQKHSALTH